MRSLSVDQDLSQGCTIVSWLSLPCLCILSSSLMSNCSNLPLGLRGGHQGWVCSLQTRNQGQKSSCPGAPQGPAQSIVTLSLIHTLFWKMCLNTLWRGNDFYLLGKIRKYLEDWRHIHWSLLYDPVFFLLLQIMVSLLPLGRETSRHFRLGFLCFQHKHTLFGSQIMFRSYIYILMVDCWLTLYSTNRILLPSGSDILLVPLLWSRIKIWCKKVIKLLKEKDNRCPDPYPPASSCF